MRVLLQIRENYRERPGGDLVQAERTTAALQSLGIDAELSAAYAPDLRGYDLVHIFNTTIIAESFRHALHARNWGVPIVLSSIYWDLGPYRAATYPPAQSALEQRHLAALLARERAWQSFVLRTADLILPNAGAEAAALRRDFPREVAGGRMRVVPNGVEMQFADGDGQRFCQQHDLPYRGFVLCAARKEDRKNQHRLIAACAALGYPLVLLGAEPPEFADYIAECHALAEAQGARVLFLPHGGPAVLADAYAAARVHALPSLFESVGLSSLEAALGGANIVSTQECAIDEYLGRAAWYCDPYAVESIKDAVAAAYAAPLQPELGRYVAEHFGWSRVGALTVRAYEQVLATAATKEHTMSEASSPQRDRWLPDLPLDEYAAYLEDLLQRQLATSDGFEAELVRLRGQVASGGADQQHELAGLRQQLQEETAERERVEAAFQQLAHDAEGLQHYCRQLEAALAQRSGPRWLPRRRS